MAKNINYPTTLERVVCLYEKYFSIVIIYHVKASEGTPIAQNITHEVYAPSLSKACGTSKGSFI
jgi:hypothetical protein